MEQSQHERIYHFVYQTKCTLNDKIYIGVHSTSDLEDGYLGSGVALAAAIEKYGRDAFQRTILHECKTPQEAYELEAKIVDSAFVSREDTYNLSIGGCGMGMLGRRPLAESIEKWKKAVVGVPKSKEHRARISQALRGHRGVVHTTETKEKIRRAHSGKKKSPEHVAKIWATRRANKLKKSS